MPTHATGQPGHDLDLLRVDQQLSSDEALVRDTVRAFTAERVMPHIADWFEAGKPPRHPPPEPGHLGLLAMPPTGHGWAGLGPVAYVMARAELEPPQSALCRAGS